MLKALLRSNVREMNERITSSQENSPLMMPWCISEAFKLSIWYFLSGFGNLKCRAAFKELYL